MIANSFSSFVALGWSLLTLGVAAADTNAGDWKFEAQLIWGTDMERPDDPELKKVDPKLVDSLKKIFRWNFYYLVNTEKLAVPEKGAMKVKLSKKCEIEVRDKGKPMIEVSLFGQGKLVNTIKHRAVNCLVMAGDDKNATAWFVVLTPQ